MHNYVYKVIHNNVNKGDKIIKYPKHICKILTIKMLDLLIMLIVAVYYPDSI